MFYHIMWDVLKHFKDILNRYRYKYYYMDLFLRTFLRTLQLVIMEWFHILLDTLSECLSNVLISAQYNFDEKNGQEMFN